MSTPIVNDRAHANAKLRGLPKCRWLRWLVVAWLMLAAGRGAADARQLQEPAWHAGVATLNITPRELLWMSGYGSRDRPAEGKLTELWAKALLLEDPAGRRCLLITLDLVGIDRQWSGRLCQRIAEQSRLDRERIALCCSHTHSGPVVGTNLDTMYFLNQQQQASVAQYTAWLQDAVTELAAKALAARQPCRLQFGQGHCPLAVNRRNNPEAEVAARRAAGTLRGPVDHDVPVLVVRGGGATPLAIVCGYACHATVLDGYQWCGDYPGYLQLELQQRHPGAVAMFWAGCGGDQNPLPRRAAQLAEKYGRRLADAVDETLNSPLGDIEGELTCSYREIDLPFGPLPSVDDWRRDAQSDNKFVAQRARLFLGHLTAGRTVADRYPYPIATWKLGTGPLWVFLGGEVVVDYSLRLKRLLATAAPQRGVWVAGYANDVMAYIPSRRVLDEGGYEGGGAMVYYGQPTVWAPAVEELIIQEVQRQAAALPTP